MLTDIYPFIAVSLFVSVALATDLKSRRIPNWLTVSSAVLGLVYHIATDGFSGLWLSLGGFATGFGLLLMLWLTGNGGGGDVKLMGALGAWLGALTTLMVFIGSAAAAVICMLAVIIWNNAKPSATAIAGGATGSADKSNSVLKQTIPYAVPVSITVLSLFLYQVILG